MYLSDSPIGEIPPADSSDNIKIQRLASACRSTSKELQHRLSIVSDMSNPGLDDPFASSASNDSSEDHDDGSDGEALEHATAHLWDSWWSPAKQNLEMRNSLNQVTPLSPHCTPSEPLSPYNRNFALDNLSDLTLSKEPLSKLHRSSAVRNARHQRRSQTNLHPHQHASVYTAFPTQPPPVPLKPQDYRCSPHGRYNSWPTRSSSRQMSRTPLLRPRANTTPRNLHAPVHNSNLSIRNTLSPTLRGSRHTSSSTTASEDPLYMRSSLSTSTQAPTPLMDMMSNEIFPEISCFEDDDDEKLGLIDSFGSRFHIRTSNGSHTRDREIDGEVKTGLRIRSKARSASVALIALKRAFKSRKRGKTVSTSSREPLDV
jgi:hypothetical protein